MRFRQASVLTGAALSLVAAGPISKFEDRKPEADYTTTAKLEDVERCLSDMDGWPFPTAFRQPDRPDAVILLWPQGGTVAGLTAYRLDLRRTSSGTHVRSWMPAKQVLTCAPRAE